MTYLFAAYIVVYVLFCSAIYAAKFLVVPAEDQKDDQGWEIAPDVSLLAVGLIGMLFLLVRYSSPSGPKPLSSEH